MELEPCQNNERPKGKYIHVDMHYCDILIINCHDHDGKKRIFETKTQFFPGGVQSVRRENGFMYHALSGPTLRAEQSEDGDEIVYKS